MTVAVARYSFGDVLLVPFPFSNQAGAKQRPAVIVSSNAYNTSRTNLIILALTSQLRQPPGFGDSLLVDWKSAGLLRASVFKPVLTALEQKLVIRILGALLPEDLAVLRTVLQQVIG